MTEVSLMCHPQSDSGGIAAIDVTATLGQGGEIKLVYRVTGALEALKIADPAIPDRADGLWKNTCFELFVENFEDKSYLEYNFAPSGQWAAYQFSGYRVGMAQLEARAPIVSVAQSVHVLTVSVTLYVPDTAPDVDLWVGISAVVATKSGEISYWALAHPAGSPDFHHKDCFALKLEARSGA
ncbi:DOMON-like domain-containing protein [Sphingorhabdus sp.]|jgi:hypothetical protein